MDERVKEHLKYLNKYYLLLLEAREIPRDEFMKSSMHRAGAERFLHLAIESCLNIGNRLIALYQFSKPVSTPETYADIFQEMYKLGVVENDFKERLIKMAKFRNRLVHLYWEIDPETVYKLLQDNLDDFRLFQEKVVTYMNHNKLSKTVGR